MRFSLSARPVVVWCDFPVKFMFSSFAFLGDANIYLSGLRERVDGKPGDHGFYAYSLRYSTVNNSRLLSKLK
jgi:hypothetical protein